MSKIIGINYGSHDASICLVEDGMIKFALEEEKFTGLKAVYAGNIFPQKGLDLIQNKFGVNFENCDHIVFSSPVKRDYIRNMDFKVKEKVDIYSHHDCHALGSYFTSGFDGKVLSLSHDGKGNRSRGKIFLCEDGQYEEYHSQHIPTTASLAGMWACATYYLGWQMLKDEGKVVGLAAHGKFSPKIYDYLKTCIRYDKLDFKPSNWESLFHYIFSHKHKDSVQNPEWRNDFAFTLQKYTEEIFEQFLTDLVIRFPDYKKLCLSGGLFANVKLNQHLNNLFLFDEIFIHPSMGDGGLSVGAAMIKAHEVGDIEKPTRLRNVFLGQEFDTHEWDQAIRDSGLDIKKEIFSYDKMPKLINEGNVIGCFFGKTEYGPRALGNRSIIVKPTDPETHEKLNQKLRRTEIMPFAPAVLKEYAHHIFDCNKSRYTAEFMTLCYNTKTDWINRIPAVVQMLDGSSRPQIVDMESNPNFHAIITSYFRYTGIPVVLNTSFNAHGEPINNYPSQVLKHLQSGAVDYIINEYYILSINRP